MSISLDEIKRGESCVVERIIKDTPSMQLLIEAGLLPETRVKLVRKAPFGDPIEIRLRGYSLSLRRADASAIWVRKGTK